jgi:hypothetical protein
MSSDSGRGQNSYFSADVLKMCYYSYYFLVLLVIEVLHKFCTNKTAKLAIFTDITESAQNTNMPKAYISILISKTSTDLSPLYDTFYKNALKRMGSKCHLEDLLLPCQKCFGKIIPQHVPSLNIFVHNVKHEQESGKPQL